jgi:hypothetical protein
MPKPVFGRSTALGNSSGSGLKKVTPFSGARGNAGARGTLSAAKTKDKLTQARRKDPDAVLSPFAHPGGIGLLGASGK